MTITKKKILILGLGKEGVSAANYLGPKNQITIFDQKPKHQIDKTFFQSLRIKNAQFYLGQKPQQNLNFDYIIRSPGIRPDERLIERLTQSGAILTSPTKIFFQECPAKIIGVTGTKGKGTTSTLIYQMLKTQNNDVFLAGNIGTPALDILPKLDAKSLVVLELSSFQLIDLAKSPHVAVVLMITSEHLDWHKNQVEYLASKESIVAHQKPTDFAVINYDFPASRALAKKTKAHILYFSTLEKTTGSYIDGEKLITDINRGRQEICDTNDILLPGRHNLQNALAAATAALILGVSPKNIARVLKTFPGLPHRFQYLGTKHGVKYYNDSYSTTPETAIAAIRAIGDPKILILGGSSKKSDFTDLAIEISRNKTIKGLILIQEEAGRIKDAIVRAGGSQAKIVQRAKNMTAIVGTAARLAASGDAVILSPACASFGMFKNYQDRGEQFIRAYEKLL